MWLVKISPWGSVDPAPLEVLRGVHMRVCGCLLHLFPTQVISPCRPPSTSVNTCPGPVYPWTFFTDLPHSEGNKVIRLLFVQPSRRPSSTRAPHCQRNMWPVVTPCFLPAQPTHCFCQSVFEVQKNWEIGMALCSHSGPRGWLCTQCSSHLHCWPVILPLLPRVSTSTSFLHRKERPMSLPTRRSSGTSTAHGSGPASLEQSKALATWCTPGQQVRPSSTLKVINLKIGSRIHWHNLQNHQICTSHSTKGSMFFKPVKDSLPQATFQSPLCSAVMDS